MERPALKEIIKRMELDASACLNDGKPFLRRSVITSLIRTFAGAIHLQYGYIENYSKQFFIDTAEGEYLERHSNIWLERKGSSYAVGKCIVTGTDEKTIPAETKLLRSDGAFFITQDKQIIKEGKAILSIKAVTAGDIGNTDAGIELNFVSPIPEVSLTATIDENGLIGGEDEERDSDLKNRLSEKFKNPPGAGNKDDYVRWAKEVAGVLDAWCIPLIYGSGTVGVGFVLDGNELPNEEKIKEVKAYIETQMPIAELFVFAPEVKQIDFEVAIFPNTQSIKELVLSSLSDYLENVGKPNQTIFISKINELISSVQGEQDHTLLNPNTNILLGSNEIAKLGNIVFKE